MIKITSIHYLSELFLDEDGVLKDCWKLGYYISSSHKTSDER